MRILFRRGLINCHRKPVAAINAAPDKTHLKYPNVPMYCAEKGMWLDKGPVRNARLSMVKNEIPRPIELITLFSGLA